MTEIRVIELFGRICVDSEDGAKLCALAHQALDRGDTVCLDFTGVTSLASAFLSPAVGCLYASLGQDDLNRRLLCKGLDPTDDAMMQLVRRNAIRFYAAKRPQQEVLATATAQAVRE